MRIWRVVKGKRFTTLYILLGIFAGSALGQPLCNKAFSPFETCNSGAERYQHIYFGEIESILPTKQRSVDGLGTFRKVIFKTERVFRGGSSGRVTLYVSSFLSCHKLQKGDRRIFYANKVRDRMIAGDQVHVSDRASLNLSGYSESLEKIALTSVCNDLRGKKRSGIEGVVIKEVNETPRSTNRNDYVRADRASEEVTKLVPGKNILLKVTNEDSSRSYHTKSDVGGYFSIRDIASGVFNLSYKIEGTSGWQDLRKYYVYESNCSRNWLVRLPAK